jgi:hypothetical protein
MPDQAAAPHPLVEVILWANDLAKNVTLDNIRHAPQLYAQWWRGVFNEAPLHILIETGLICFILWLVFIRRTVDPKQSTPSNSKLSASEIKWLIDSWEPEPLVPTKTQLQEKISNEIQVRSVFILALALTSAAFPCCPVPSAHI